ncbi:hypothetical protein [Caballeronia sp. DA-9]|uniref:hypothetical protein n=1 Tax=Caballeronia sp. DA-9 TaxID=3436237 RepID=UPI003F66784E
MNDNMHEAKAAIKCDLYVLGWVSVSLGAALGLCVLIGPAGLGIAAIVGVAGVWKACWSKHRVSKRLWWYFWSGLLVLDAGMAFFETHPWFFSVK